MDDDVEFIIKWLKVISALGNWSLSNFKYNFIKFVILFKENRVDIIYEIFYIRFLKYCSMNRK